MRPPLTTSRPPAAAVVLALAGLAAPPILAFFAGGYFDGPRDWALILAGVLLAACALLLPVRALLPRNRHARMALAGLALLTAWTAWSTSWAPLNDNAWATFERDALYLVALVIAGAVLRFVPRVVEPALAGGVLVVVGYGLLGRLIPDVVHAAPSLSAGGRLDQPLTYWNAMGAMGAIGFVLCVRVAGDETRGVAWRPAGAAVAVPLAVGIYLTFSRGALAATAAGLVVLLALAPSFTQLRAAAIAVEAGIVGCGVAAAAPAVRTLNGSHAALQGAAVLVALLLLMGIAAFVQAWACRDEGDERVAIRRGRLPLPRRHGWVAAFLVAAMLVVPVALATGSDAPSSSSDPRFGASTSRLASTDSPRYHYWKVAINAFADEPLKGLGAGGFAVRWLQDRPVRQPALNAHSAELQTLAELGIVGGLLLALFGAGVGLAARDAARRLGPAAVSGPIAALSAYTFHATIDWDWEMPALTLIGITLAGALLAASDTDA